MLTARSVESAKSREKPFKLFDADGLYLYVSPKGSKSWRTRTTKNGKETVLTYGRYPEMSLASARQAHAVHKSKRTLNTDTFSAVFNQWLEIKLPSLANPKNRMQLESSMVVHVLPVIGDKLLTDIRRVELVNIIQSIAAKGTLETAQKISGRIRMVFDHAVDLGLIDTHPAHHLSRVIRDKKVVKPMVCIAPGEAPELFQDIRAYTDPITRYALLMLAYTFTRTQELRFMQWDEIREAEKLWVIPQERMKMKRPHVVPLSRQSLEVLESVRDFSGNSSYVFASLTNKGKPISENTMLFALYRMGYRGRMTGHGFRSLASTVLNQQGFQADAIERQLAHKETDAIRAAYNRAEYLEQRKVMMQWWADWIGG